MKFRKKTSNFISRLKESVLENGQATIRKCTKRMESKHGREGIGMEKKCTRMGFSFSPQPKLLATSLFINSSHCTLKERSSYHIISSHLISSHLISFHVTPFLLNRVNTKQDKYKKQRNRKQT